MISTFPQLKFSGSSPPTNGRATPPLPDCIAESTIRRSRSGLLAACLRELPGALDVERLKSRGRRDVEVPGFCVIQRLCSPRPDAFWPGAAAGADTGSSSSSSSRPWSSHCFSICWKSDPCAPNARLSSLYHDGGASSRGGASSIRGGGSTSAVGFGGVLCGTRGGGSLRRQQSLGMITTQIATSTTSDPRPTQTIGGMAAPKPDEP